MMDQGCWIGRNQPEIIPKLIKIDHIVLRQQIQQSEFVLKCIRHAPLVHECCERMQFRYWLILADIVHFGAFALCGSARKQSGDL